MITLTQIVDAQQRMSTPLTQAHLMRLAQMCEIHSGTRVLDLACGKGELLNQWAKAFDLKGTGVDEEPHNIDVAQTRANELEVWSQVHFVESDVLDYPQDFHQYNVVSWIGTGGVFDMTAMLKNMQSALRDNENGLLLIGETFWRRLPTQEVSEALHVSVDVLLDLGDLVDHFTQTGMTVLDMLILSQDDWDAFYTAQWRAITQWLKENPEHPNMREIEALFQASRRNYLKYEREYIGWGVFVLEAMGNRTVQPTHSEEPPLWVE